MQPRRRINEYLWLMANMQQSKALRYLGMQRSGQRRTETCIKSQRVDSQYMGMDRRVRWALLTFIVPCGWGNRAKDAVVRWLRVMMKWPWCKALLLLLLPAPLPPAVTRIDEHGPARRHWARLQTYRFVLCAAVLQSVPLLPLIGCNSSKAILSARPAHVPYCSEGERVGGRGWGGKGK